MSTPAPTSRTTHHHVPGHLKSAVVLLSRLLNGGVLRAVPEKLWVSRRPGATLVDALVFLVAFFSTQRSLWGLRGFYDGNLGSRTLLSGAAGQSTLISPSALSRFLKAVNAEQLSTFGAWLLREGSGCTQLLMSPHVQTRDGQGNSWHMLDFDPTRTAVRQRALLEDDAFPAGERRLDDLCAPGHFGRKRGETGWSEHVLHHSGSGLVLQTTVGAGNGSAHRQFQAALMAAKELSVATGHPLSRILVRADGEFGQAPFLADARRDGVQMLTRCSRYSAVLSDAELRRRLAGRTWERVKDAGSGPCRYALDLGIVSLAMEGEPAVEVRLVASRFTETSDRGVGHAIDGERLELFMCLGLTAEAWSAADVVTMYYGRIAQENRFGQADREVKDRAYSKNVGGEQLACIAAGLVWNMSIVQGVSLTPIVGVPPVAVEPRVPDFVSKEALVEATSSPEIAVPASDATDPGSVATLLARLDIAQRAARKGLTWDPERRSVDDGQDTFASASLEKNGLSFRLRFASAAGKRVDILLTGDEGRELRPLWATERRPGARPASSEDGRRFAPTFVVITEPPGSTPPFAVTPATFLPATARRMFAADVQQHEVIVTITVGPRPVDTRHPLIEPNIHRRRHQRYSTAERIARRQRAPWIALTVRLSELHTSRIPSLKID